MKIHEYQGKEILRRFGIPVPKGIAAYTAQEALEAAQKLGGDKWVVKAQIHAGGRGKGGGVQLAQSTEAVRKIAGDILGMQLVTYQTDAKGQKVRRLYIEEAVDIQQEYYLSIVTDRSSQKIAFIASSEGGVNIEEIAHTQPEKIIQVLINPIEGMTTAHAHELAQGIGLAGTIQAQFVEICQKLYTCYMETDASLLEINPLNIDNNGNVIALDAKFNFDANALYRHPEIMAYRDLDEEDPNEIEASKFDLAYISLDGDIGCLVNGAGLAMATMDTIKLYGAEPANFLDVGGGASTEKVTEAFKIMLRNTNVKAILVNIFGGIMKCDTIAEGVVAASRTVGLNVPLVVRMKGTNEAQGKKILAESGLPIITADTMTEAAEKVVAAAQAAPAKKNDTNDTPATLATHATAPAAPSANGSAWGKWFFLGAMALMAVLMLKFCGSDQTPLANTPPASKTEAATKQAPAEVALGAWQAQVENGKLLLQGSVPSEEAKAQMLVAARAAFGDNGINDQLTIDNNLPVFQGAGAISDVFAWLKQHTTTGLTVAANSMTFTGSVGEPFIADLAVKIHTWFGGGISLDVSAIEPTVVPAAKALQLGLKNFRINVEFDTGTATLRPSAKEELNTLAQALKAQPIKGEIEGHTDNTGDYDSNLALSKQRSQAVKAYLVKRGVDASTLKATGYGQDYPIADNNTQQGQQRNRRVDFIVR